MTGQEKILGQVKVIDLTLSRNVEIRIKQLEAIQEFLLSEGRNNEDVNSELLKLRKGG